MAVLSARNRVSRRDVVELVEELFGARISAGTVDAILARTASALKDPYEQLLGCVRLSEAVNMDETGWRLKGAQRALWGMFTARHAIFHVAADRHEDHAKDLLAGHEGIVTSDRWWGYNHLPLARRQSAGHTCAETSRRTPKACRGERVRRGRPGSVRARLRAWEVFQHTHNRDELKRTIEGLASEYQPIIAGYASKRARNKYCRGMARNLIKAWSALWTFAARDGVQPTNNHAERSLRGAVIYRKLSLGSQSQDGEKRTQRLLSASITYRLQHRSLFEYLTDTITAHAHGHPAPNLT